MLNQDYDRLKESLGLAEDSSQRELIRRLELYRKKLNEQSLSWWRKLKEYVLTRRSAHKFGKSGMYIWGDVGRGKTMLMDLFFEKIENKNKRRQHFHQFMSDFHKYGRTKETAHISHSVTAFVNNIASKHQLLCLDELQVNNVADAMVLHRLFSKLIKKNILIMITSNFHPDDLFKDGIQRERFMPFIDLIKNKWTIYNLNNFKDYRLNSLDKMEQFYYYPLNAGAALYLATMLSALIGNHIPHPIVIKISETRNLEILQSYGSLAKFDFGELCTIATGVEDYMALSRKFKTIIIINIPQLTNEQHNEALRFITLIDCLYEAKIKLICTAAVSIDEIYSGQKHKIEFKRTISRLHEMQSRKYINLKN